MADELDLLQEQDELLNQLHIQAARQRSCLDAWRAKAVNGANAVAIASPSGGSRPSRAYVPARNVSGFWKYDKNSI